MTRAQAVEWAAIVVASFSLSYFAFAGGERMGELRARAETRYLDLRNSGDAVVRFEIWAPADSGRGGWEEIVVPPSYYLTLPVNP